jgi:hypothetical protein
MGLFCNLVNLSNNECGVDSMKRHLNHVIPWIWLVAFLNFEMKGLDRDAMYFLYIAAIYALADISREKVTEQLCSTGACILLQWAVYSS